ncbi:hypothetical protein IL306_000281 [Fusarium sp. DS 682]|nr:hypothetical protein IL306_000281 [Fusarium sp. DS 682]
MCDAVRKALGNDDFVNNAETNCNCLSNAIFWGNSPSAKHVFDGQVNANQAYLEWIQRDETCLFNNDYTITTDRASVVKNQLAATNGWTFVRAPEANVCKNNACKGATPANAFKKYASTIATIKSLQGVPNAAEKSLANIPKMTQITKNAIKYTTTAADEAYYVKLINDYQVNSLRDVIKAFRVTQYLPQAGEELKKYTGTFNLISNHAGAAKTGATSINQILSVNWARNSELAKTASGRKVRDGLINIQKSFRNEFKRPLDNLIKANKAVEDILNQLPLRKKRLEFASGGVSYSRWANARMPVPCRKEATRQFGLGGISKGHTYEEIQACEFGPTKVPFIKHVIPYMKYRFV